MIKWNFCDENYSTVQIHHITAKRYLTEHPQGADEMRLLALSHKFASFKFPAAFSSNVPATMTHSPDEPCVVVFDINSCFSDDLVPFWANDNKIVWNSESEFIQQNIGLLQKALNLREYYNFSENSPIYFNSFLFLQPADPFPDPIIYKIYPIISNRCLGFRKNYEVNSSLIVGYKHPLASGTFILIPPCDIPWKVLSSFNKKLTVINSNNVKKTIDIMSTPFIIISKPSSLLQAAFSNGHSEVIIREQSVQTIGKEKTRIKPFEPHQATAESIALFFAEKFGRHDKETARNDTEDEEATLVDPPIVFDDVLTEVVENKEMAAKIKEILAFVNASNVREFGVVNESVTLKARPMETFASDTYSIDYSKAPSFADRFFVDAVSRNIESPQLRANKCGKFVDAVTNSFIEKWEENLTYPIFGPKDGEFIVFYEKGLEKRSVTDYFMQLSHAYSLLGFGKMIPFSQSTEKLFDVLQYANECEPKKAISNAEKFFGENKIISSREVNVICYVITQSMPESSVLDSKRQFGIRWLLSDDVDGAVDNDYKEEAFKLYSLIRKRSSAPISEIFNTRTYKLPDFLFGFRYQHPFLIKRTQGNVMNVHIFLNPRNERSIWVDDSGSTLTRLSSSKPSLIKECINEIRQLCNSTTVMLKFSLTIVSEYVDEQRLEALKADVGNDASIFSAFPAPFIQAKFQSGITEDVFVESSYEISFFPLKQRRRFGESATTRAANHILSGFVISNGLQAYQVGILSSALNEDPRNVLNDYINQISALSWLTMKPNFPKRTTSLPPPVIMLLNESEQNTTSYARVPFSTQLEKCKL